MNSSMPGVQTAEMTPAVMPVAVVGACSPNGMAAVLLPATSARLMEPAHAVADASKPFPLRAQARSGRQDSPQLHNLPKFAYKNRIAAANGAAAGPQPAWDPV